MELSLRQWHANGKSQSADDFVVDLAAPRHVGQDQNRVVRGFGGFVGPPLGKGTINVADREHPGQRFDLIAAQLVRITAAVEKFVMMGG